MTSRMSNPVAKGKRSWSSFWGKKPDNEETSPRKWTMGILEDKETIEVPGSVLLLAADYNQPLGLRNTPARTSHSSIPTGIPHQLPEDTIEPPKKRTPDGKIILDPQPEDSANDPLNWPAWRRDLALVSLGLFCMVGGGTTPILAAGFTDVAQEYGVDVESVSLTTGLYMLGMGLGSVIFSPTAILWGKRPVYLFGAVVFMATSVWCAASPNFASLIVARILQGVAVSPVECLPSATIAEIFFLHERAFRIGIYTLLLLGGKNLIPLVSAVIIQRMGWRWVFWIVTIVVGFCSLLLFLFVPETFWDRAPVPRKSRKRSRPGLPHRLSSRHNVPQVVTPAVEPVPSTVAEGIAQTSDSASRPHRVGFAADIEEHVIPKVESSTDTTLVEKADETRHSPCSQNHENEQLVDPTQQSNQPSRLRPHAPRSYPSYGSQVNEPSAAAAHHAHASLTRDTDSESQSLRSAGPLPYTAALREQPPRSFIQSLKPFNGRLNKDKWHKVVVRPLILFTYPAVLWSAVVYSCSVGWLIVISESVAIIYREDIYHFNALQTGLVYISPFVGGVLGSAVAGRVSDMIVKAMARRNGGLYEPEFRLVMAIPIALTTVIGLMGFGWSAQAHNHWMVPTAFFGIVSFGCTLGSTTSITFCVDSYRQYAGEALVTLNFSKNVFHGLVFSLFVTDWLSDDGPKTVFIWIGIIQLILLFFTIPMYILGKRARMWTVRKNFMERF